MHDLNPWLAKATVLAGSIVMVAIRAPHGHRSTTVKVKSSGKGPVETLLLTFAWLGFFVPLIWVVSPWLSFADYPLHAIPLASGIACLAVGLWFFHRSHADLGTNWSVTLQVREDHQLVTGGIYRNIRHPMYAALLLYSIGQALVIPNWIAGPCYLVPMMLLIAFRIGPEERLMREEFGDRYRTYAATTKRLVPHVW